MINTIALTSKVAKAELNGVPFCSPQQAKIISALAKLSAPNGIGSVVGFKELKSRVCRTMTAKRLRSQLRALRAARLISVTKQ